MSGDIKLYHTLLCVFLYPSNVTTGYTLMHVIPVLCNHIDLSVSFQTPCQRQRKQINYSLFHAAVHGLTQTVCQDRKLIISSIIIYVIHLQTPSIGSRHIIRYWCISNAIGGTIHLLTDIHCIIVTKMKVTA